MKKYFLFIILFPFLVLKSEGQITFQKIIGGVYSERAFAIQQLNDRGYIIAGAIYRFSGGYNYDIYLVRTDSLGNTLFIKNYDAGSWEMAYSIKQTNDGGFIIGGTAFNDILIIKTDSSGNIQYSRRYSGIYGDDGYCIQITKDGGFILTGSTSSFGAGQNSVYVIKTDNNGNVEFSKSYGGQKADEAFDIKQTMDSGFIIAGISNSFTDGYDAYLLKIDSIGDVQWSNIYGDNNFDGGYSVEQTPDRGFILTGTTLNDSGINNYNILLIKTDSIGNLIWNKTFNITAIDKGSVVHQTFDGGYIISGFTDGANGNLIFIVKTDSLGVVEFAKTYGDAQEYNKSAMQITSDGGFIIASSTFGHGAGKSDIYLIKADVNGNTWCNNEYNVSTITLSHTIQVSNVTTLVSQGGIMSNLTFTPTDITDTSFFYCAGSSNFNLNIIHTDAICNVTKLGTATAITSGGLSPYTYLWNTTPVQTTSSITGLRGGIYHCTVTDSTGDKASNFTIIQEPTSLLVDIFQCFDGNERSAIVSPIGGTLPYSYLWNTNPTQTTAMVTNLSFDSIYYCRVTDANGCIGLDSIIITDSSSLSLYIDTYPASCDTCADGNASVYVSNGSPPYYYLWSNRNCTQSYCSGLSPGNYSVYVHDTLNNYICDSVVISFGIGISENLKPIQQIIIYPNPSNFSLTIAYWLNTSDVVNLEIYNVLGEKVSSLVNNEKQTIGKHEYYFSAIVSGIYFVKLKTMEKLFMQKIVQLR